MVMKLRLKELRKEYGYLQIFIAEYLNIKQNTYSMYENGQREIPLESLAKLSVLYETSVDYIMRLTDDDIPHLRKK